MKPSIKWLLIAFVYHAACGCGWDQAERNHVPKTEGVSSNHKSTNCDTFQDASSGPERPLPMDARSITNDTANAPDDSLRIQEGRGNAQADSVVTDVPSADHEEATSEAELIVVKPGMTISEARTRLGLHGASVDLDRPSVEYPDGYLGYVAHADTWRDALILEVVEHTEMVESIYWHKNYAADIRLPKGERKYEMSHAEVVVVGELNQLEAEDQ